MAEHETFVPKNVFRRMLNDDLRRKHVNAEDLYNFLAESKNVDEQEAQSLLPNISREQCEVLLGQFDNDRDGELSYQEFLPIIMPSQNKLLEQAALARRVTKRVQGQRLDYDIEYALYKILITEIQLQNNLENLKRSLQALDVDITELFKAARCYDDNYLHINNHLLRMFLSRNGVPVLEYKVNLVLSKLDRDRDGVINHKDFIAAIVPYFPVEVEVELPEYGDIGRKLARNNARDPEGQVVNGSPPRYKTPYKEPE